MDKKGESSEKHGENNENSERAKVQFALKKTSILRAKSNPEQIALVSFFLKSNESDSLMVALLQFTKSYQSDSLTITLF